MDPYVDISISKASDSDITDIQRLAQNCIKDMNEHGITQWNEQYPPMDIFFEDIRTGSLFKLCKGDILVGIIVLSTEQEEQYNVITWLDNSGRFLVVHRLAVDPKYQRKGFSVRLMHFAENFALENDLISIRIDTFSKNIRTLNLFKKLGFERRSGEIHFPENKEPYYCFEKVLVKS